MTPHRTDAPQETSAEVPGHVPDTAGPVTVRFYAAAAEAAGAEQLHLPLPADGIAVVDFLADLPQAVEQQQGFSSDDDAASAPSADGSQSGRGQSGAPSLQRVCARSSFLVNGVRARAETARLQPGDQLDVLPPFAGG